ncbi:MAG: YqeG family HAD IIIA-type phosphatase [Clostridiales bacterium]|nr:YqeG family HAD IIIA-type phosphatase [Clostridiales bacterium]
MFQKFYPDIYVDSAYRIDFDSLYADGYRGLIFDIDNTLVTHGAPADEKAIALFDHLKELGFCCCLLSNNDEPRVKMFNDSVCVRYIFDAHKPSTEGYRRAMELMGTDEGSTIFIGDQIFTDIFGANRTGIPTIMVKYIYWKEEIQIVFKRRLEAIVLLFYRGYRKHHPDTARGEFFRGENTGFRNRKYTQGGIS